MGRNMTISRSMVALLLISIAMVVSPAVNSLPTGVNYDQISAGGCNCHAAAPNAAVMVTLDGLPEVFEIQILILYLYKKEKKLFSSFL